MCQNEHSSMWGKIERAHVSTWLLLTNKASRDVPSHVYVIFMRIQEKFDVSTWGRDEHVAALQHLFQQKIFAPPPKKKIVTL